MVDLNDILFEKQRAALAALANNSPYTEVLYGGAAGGGKSLLGCAWQIARRLKYPESRGLIGRSKLDALKKSTLRTFFEVAKSFGLKSGTHYTFNGQTNIISFFNGSEIFLKDLFYYPSDPNFDSLGSTEYTDAFIDECPQITPKARDIVKSRLRHKTKEYGISGKVLMTCNPAKGWVYNEFYDPFKYGTLAPFRAFIQALPTDNPHLDPQYLQMLEQLPEHDRKRLLFGEWEYDTDIDRLFTYDDLHRLFRDETLTDGKRYITADVARLGKDKTVIGVWEGFTLIHVSEIEMSRINETVDAIRKLQQTYGVALNQVLVDEDGLGGGVVDYLKCRGFVGGSKSVTGTTNNLRSDCYFKLAELLEKSKVSINLAKELPRFKDLLIQELDATRRKNPDLDMKLQVISKDDIKKTLGRSPDYADMLMMRAYFDLRKNYGVYTVG
jgi:phage terminase large subunit